MMYVVGEMVLKDIMTALVEATHSIVNEMGDHIVVGTIDDNRLRMAALQGLQIAVGDAIWPAANKIKLPKRSRLPGPFVEEE